MILVNITMLHTCILLQLLIIIIIIIIIIIYLLILAVMVGNIDRILVRAMRVCGLTSVYTLREQIIT